MQIKLTDRARALLENMGDVAAQHVAARPGLFAVALEGASDPGALKAQLLDLFQIPHERRQALGIVLDHAIDAQSTVARARAVVAVSRPAYSGVTTLTPDMSAAATGHFISLVWNDFDCAWSEAPVAPDLRAELARLCMDAAMLVGNQPRKVDVLLSAAGQLGLPMTGEEAQGLIARSIALIMPEPTHAASPHDAEEPSRDFDRQNVEMLRRRVNSAAQEFTTNLGPGPVAPDLLNNLYAFLGNNLDADDPLRGLMQEHLDAMKPPNSPPRENVIRALWHLERAFEARHNVISRLPLP